MKDVSWIDVGGVRTRHLMAGAGKPVVFLHGGGVDYRYPESADSGFPAADLLAGSFRVYLPDKLGHGQTDSPAHENEFTAEATITHLTRYMELLGIEHAVLVGHSRGALPALQLALTRPDLVSHVVTLNSSTFAPPDFGLSTDFYTHDLRGGLPDRESLVGLFARLFHHDSAEREEYFRTVLANIEKPHPQRPMTREAIARVAIIERDHFRPSFTRLKEEVLSGLSSGALLQPLLIVWGADDPSAPFELATHLFSLASAGGGGPVSLVGINRSGHYPQLEHPAQFAAQLEAWVSSS